MKASDYITSFFVEHQIEYVFGCQGGMITHLVDSISKNKNIQFIPCYHEQSAAIAAEGYARASGKFGVAISTSGPGATNMTTGIANAFFDSIPVVYITGQVNTYEYKYRKPIRQSGFQETDIVSIVTPITKYVVMIDDAARIRYELEKAVFTATTGRKGPVLLDVPMNIQRSEVDPSALAAYQGAYKKPAPDKERIQKAVSLLEAAKRPLVLCGGGVATGNAGDKINQFLTEINVPYVVSLMGKGGVDETSDTFVGMIGSYGNRCANIAFANADVVLALGSRLDVRQTGNKNMEAVRDKQFIHVDIDRDELNEDSVPNKLTIHTDIVDFIDKVKENGAFYCNDNNWLNFIASIKGNYSQKKDVERFLQEREPYSAIEKIVSLSDSDTIFTVDVGQNQMWAAQAVRLKPGQSFFTSGGLAAMGYALHAAIGAAFSSPEKKIICILGDGGFHIALQSLLLISQYKLKITLFILNNYALGMITQFQSLYFNGNMPGTTKNGGYEVPDIKNIARACRLEYYGIDDIERQRLPVGDSGKIVEIKLHGLTSVIPKLEFDKPLHNMLPYLTEKEMENLIPPPPRIVLVLYIFRLDWLRK